MADSSIASAARHRRVGGVYEIVCATSGNRYIGSAIDFEKRWKAHRFHLGRGTHHSRHLQSAWRLYGASVFVFRPLLLCSRSNRLMYEQRALDVLRPEYNVAPLARGGGTSPSPEARARLSAAMRGNTRTLGYRHTSEAIDKLRAKQTGVPSPTKGRPRDPVAVAATAAAHRGMKRSPETCARISAARVGKKMPPRSEAHRAAISSALKGRRMNQASIDKMAATKRGGHLSPEHKAKIGEASRRAWALRKGRSYA